MSVAMQSPRAFSWRQWLRATRPHSFAASLVPVAVGSACAAFAHSFDGLMFLLAVSASVLLQGGTNLVNDYFDWRSGADTEGPSGRLLREKLLEPHHVRLAGLLLLTAGSVAGLAIVAIAGWPILALGVIGVVFAYFYTAPPLKLAYRGLGEVVVFVLMGPGMVLGGYLVHQPSSDLLTPLIASVPVGCLVATILQVNNIRDIDLDRASGKRTLATRIGVRAARREFDVLLAGAYLSLIVGVVIQRLPWPGLLALITLPLALSLRALVQSETRPESLAPGVRRAAGLHLRFGLLLALGIGVAALFARG
ncbi:MAG: 1,4-dihydroxy-2-naphthoate polyprenyltransferase [Chloroflexota bacterium]